MLITFNNLRYNVELRIIKATDFGNTGMSKNRRYFMIGNALVTKIINKVEKELSKIIDNE